MRSRRAMIVALAAVSAVAIAVFPTAATAVGPETGSISGTVFQDYDSDGFFDATGVDPADPGNPALSRDRGIGGVLVTAFDADQDVVGQAVSGPTGAYTVQITGARTRDIRLDFSDLPDGYFPSFSVLAGVAGGAAVSRSDTQLVQIGATGADFGVNAPGDYAQVVDGSTPVVTSILYAGDRANGQTTLQPSIVSYPWLDALTGPANAPTFNEGAIQTNRMTLATYGQTGTVSAIVEQRSTGDVYAGAALKRHADLGPAGLGGIYVIRRVIDPATGLQQPFPTPTPLPESYDLETLSAGAVDLYPDPLTAADFTAAARALGAPDQTSEDPEAYDQAGRIGLGGMAVSADGSTLYVVNLTQKRVETLDITGAVPVYTGSIDLGLGADDMPWAITVARGRILVGYIANASAGDTLPAGPAPFATDAELVVRAAAETAPADLATAGSEVLRAPLDYHRGAAYIGGGNGCEATQTTNPQCYWHPWTNEFVAPTPTTSSPMNIGQPTFIAWTQPILTGLELTADGNLVLGLKDRFTLQSGRYNVGPNGETAPGGAPFQGFSGGDVLLAGAGADGSFTLESNGTVTGPTGTITGAGAGNAQGPGGGEFFVDWNAFGIGQEHHENTLGYIATLPGADQIAVTAFDPTRELQSGGYSWFSTGAGTQPRARVVALASTPGTLQKAGGIGGLTTLLTNPPLQIGNVVWFDADQDGIQDADEPVVPGVGVELWRPGAAAALATTTTDTNGQYYFATPDVDGFDPLGGDYEVRFVLPSAGDLFVADARFGTVPWADVAFTVPNAPGAADEASLGIVDAIDSDAVVEADPRTGTAAYTAGGPGENDPTLDAGLIAFTGFTVTKQLAEDSVPPRPGAVFTMQVTAQDFRSDPIDLGADASFVLPFGGSHVVEGLPVGTRASVTEADPAPAFTFEVDPEGLFLVGSTDVVGRSVTVTNRVVTGGFSIDKLVNDPSGTLPDGTEFTIQYTVDGGPPIAATATVGTPLVVDGLAVGSEIVVTEVDLPSAYAWAVPVWSSSSPGVTIGDGTASFAIAAGATPAIDLTVTNEVLVGGFGIQKLLVDSAGAVPSGTRFTASWTLDGVAQPDISLTVGEAPQVFEDLPVGAVVRITELTFPDGFEWADPSWTLGGAPTDAVSFTIGDTDVLAAVTLTNEAIPPLPPTGADVGALLRSALTLLLAGAVLIMAARRMRRTES